jgi:hypothetical protein
MTSLPLTSAFLIGSRRSLRLVERNLYVYKHGWLVLLSGFFEPLFYLLRHHAATIIRSRRAPPCAPRPMPNG